MLYREIINVSFQILTKHINKLCGQYLDLYYYTVDTTGLQRVKTLL
jgi:hypothetical protein